MNQLILVFKFLFSILILIAYANSLVYKFTANQVQLSPKASIHRNNYLTSLLKQRNPGAFARKERIERRLKSRLGKESSSSINVTEIKYLLIGNISVGTPPQTFSVEFDPFYTRDFNLIDSEANAEVYGNIPPKKAFNSSASSTYVQRDGNFTYEGTGHKGNDIVKIGDLSTAMTFGILDKVGYRYHQEPVDGIFGMYLTPSLNNLTDAVIQFAGQLDKPIVSVWIGRASGGGIAQFTFGAEDINHCDHNSDYVPLIEMGYSYGFHLSTATANVNGIEVSVGFNSTVHFVPWQEHIYCERNFLDILVNASGAVYSTLYSRYDVDCAVKKAGQVWLNIGGNGSSTSDKSKQILLTGADYIKQDTHSGNCYLAAISAPWYQGFVELGMNFLQNHCFSYNVNEKTIAFSNVK